MTADHGGTTAPREPRSSDGSGERAPLRTEESMTASAGRGVGSPYADGDGGVSIQSSPDDAGSDNDAGRHSTSDHAEAPLRGDVFEPAAPPSVVAIICGVEGTSELQRFFRDVAPDAGVAFVIVGNFDAEESRHQREMMAATTPMLVRVVDRPMALEPDTIYQSQPRMFIELRDGQLSAVEPPAPEVKRCPGDYALQCVAREKRERSIAVVLSGTGNDGTLGLRSVEAAGGISLVLNPDVAACDQLPRSAIRTGVVDHVVGPDRMVEIVVRYTHHRYVERVEHADSEATRATERSARGDLNEIISVLRSRAGYNFQFYKKSTLTRRIDRRLGLGLGQFNSYAEYAEHLRANPGELNELFYDLLIGVTEFFRDPEAWDELRRLVVEPMVAARTDDETIRVWVAGCATGEEAYSIAIIFLDELRLQRKSCMVQVFASDINDGALEIARAGLYPKSIATNVPKRYLARYFTEIAGDYQYAVNKVVRESVTFARQNLIGDPPFSKLDLVCCRNLLIYLESEIQQRTIAVFHFALRSGGYLFLGTAETIGRQVDLFLPLSKRWRIYSRSDAPRREVMPFPVSSLAARNVHRDAVRTRAISEVPRLSRVAQQIILEQYAPAAVLVDRNFDIHYFSGPTSEYLVQPSGAPTNDLLIMAREGLRTKLRRFVQLAAREGHPVRATDLRVKRNGEFHNVAVTIAPVTVDQDSEPLLLVVFEEVANGRVDAANVDHSVVNESLVRQLENELTLAREDLKTHIEEVEASNEDLKVANEEVMSINEELQSANEELETSKEELQSLNEELSTVNHQLQEKLEELEATDNDLSNLLTSTEIATIFLDRDFRIKRFTTAVQKVLNIIPADIGRPIGDFSRKVNDDDLLEDACAVLEQLVPAEREVSTSDGRWFLRRILPYRTESNHIGGVVITFIDTTALRDAGARLAESEAKYRLLVESTSDFAIFMLDVEGRFKTWNSGVLKILGYGEAEIIGRSSSIIFVPEDRAKDEDARELETARLQGRAADERWHLRKDGTRFWGSGVVTPLYDAGGLLRGYSKVMRDQTERRRMESELKQLTETLEQMVAERTAALRALSTELLIAEERERREFAADLHDSIGQTLALASIRLKEGMRAPEAPLDEIVNLIESANEAVRSVTMQISPPLLYQIGLLPALEWLAEEMERRYGLNVVVEAGEAPQAIDDRVRFVLFRSVRELLINVTKHAGVNDARVRINAVGEHIVVEVDDNGKGFEATGAAITRRANGFGLFSIRERLSYIGGEATIRSTPGIGTTVVLRAPVHIQSDSDAGV